MLLLLALLPLGDGLDDDGRLLLGSLLGELVTCSEREGGGAGQVRSGQVKSQSPTEAVVSSNTCSTCQLIPLVGTQALSAGRRLVYYDDVSS